MSHEPPQPPPPGGKPSGPTGPTPSGPGGYSGRHTPRSGNPDTRQDLAAGGTVFAGIMLMVAGVLAILEGIVGIAKDSVYVTTSNYTYKFDVTAWGWLHLSLGIVAVLVGYGLLSGIRHQFARYAGVFIAALALVSNFMFLPYQPIWSIIMIAIYTFVIWALTTYRRPGEQRSGGVR